jgi:hypothetical protein
LIFLLLLPQNVPFLIMRFIHKFYPSFFLFLGILFQVNAQINVSFPVSRAIFQRNNQNRGFINIIGNYYETIERVEARLLPAVSGQGFATNWQIVDAKPKAGNFFGQIEGQGGWYRLEIRAIQGGNIRQILSIDKVGIGEVFVCAGQSNAEGIAGMNPKSATDDRVNAIDFNNYQLEYPLPEVLAFQKLTDEVAIAPAGNNAWCWGELGDKLAQRFNVPILFFNAGLSRTAITNWRESAEGILSKRYDDNGNGQIYFPLNYPYNHLRGTLNYYASLLGVRALLWQQGETDNRRTSYQDYLSNLQKVINYSRQDFNTDLTWVVARTSRSYQLSPDNNIIQAQEYIINRAGNNVFGGPNTDVLQVPRPDGIHFGNVRGYGNGLSVLADAWNEALNDVFFRFSSPVLPKNIANYTVACNGANEAMISLSADLQTYEWSNGTRRNTVVGNGDFSVKAYDFRGNRIPTPSFSTQWLYPTSIPRITANKPLEFCAYDSARVELKGNGNEFINYLWNTGEKADKIIIKTDGSFTARGINEFGCLSARSDAAIAKTQPLPIQPIILSKDNKSVCEGSRITLSSDTGQKFLWSNGANTSSITLDKVGEYNISLQTISDFGCFSPHATIYQAVIKPKPISPEITQIGTFTLIAEKGNFLNNDKFEWKKDENIINTTAVPSIKIIENGNYKVSTIRTYQVLDNQSLSCYSNPSKILNFVPAKVSTMLYPNPIAMNVVSLETKENHKNLQVDFYDNFGKKVLSSFIQDSTEKQIIDLTSIPKGMYWVKIFNENISETLKIYVEK